MNLRKLTKVPTQIKMKAKLVSLPQEQAELLEGWRMKLKPVGLLLVGVGLASWVF